MNNTAFEEVMTDFLERWNKEEQEHRVRLAKIRAFGARAERLILIAVFSGAFLLPFIRYYS